MNTLKKIDDKKIKKELKMKMLRMEENIEEKIRDAIKEDIENGNFGKSRNTFVLNCTEQ